MKQIAASLACIGLLFTVGCGPGVSPVTGTVTLDGKPAADLLVAFTPDGGGTSGAATTDASGNYSISSPLGNGLPQGNYTIRITSQPPVDDSMTESTDYSDEEYDGGSMNEGYDKLAEGEQDEYEQFKELIPAKYNSNTTLKEEIVAGENSFNFELTTD